MVRLAHVGLTARSHWGITIGPHESHPHPGGVAAIATYNARSTEHNRRVHEHNRHIADLNGRTAMLNGDSARLDSLYARSDRPSDRDAILIERGRIR